MEKSPCINCEINDDRLICSKCCEKLDQYRKFIKKESYILFNTDDSKNNDLRYRENLGNGSRWNNTKII